MAENFNLIFGSQAPTTATWTDADYQTGWSTVGSTPPTAEQFDFLQNRADLKAKELNDALTPLVQKSEADGRQAGTIYASGACVTVDGLPNGWLLECVVPGTSGTVAITLPDPLIDGATIIDGDVTWALRKVATNGGLGYRQPNTAYTAGQIAYHSALPTGWYLECTTPGTTAAGALTISSPTIGGTVSDGTVTWTVCKGIGTGNAPIYAGYNQKQTFTSSGTFVAPVTGLYKITLQGGGGGGSGAGNNDYGHCSGSGGGSGAKLEFYEKLNAGQSYSFTVGAGGAGGAAGSSSTAGASGTAGGNTTITLNSKNYIAGGGDCGYTTKGFTWGGYGGVGIIDSAIVTAGFNGETGNTNPSMHELGGKGGGAVGIYNNSVYLFGGGGNGGVYDDGGTITAGGAGGDGYITFEWLDTSLL